MILIINKLKLIIKEYDKVYILYLNDRSIQGYANLKYKNLCGLFSVIFKKKDKRKRKVIIIVIFTYLNFFNLSKNE